MHCGSVTGSRVSRIVGESLLKSPCRRIIEQNSQVTQDGTLRGSSGQGRIRFIFKPRRSVQQLLVGETEVVAITGIIAAELSSLLGHRSAAKGTDHQC